ncbi:phosphotransferase system sugar-specific permease component [Lucifera butyrica]|uniref:Phosphotransferase system sugar-specific permease component n=1 Tax=Lucifera butyrica TaxID=1351585 RepID=A0A498R1N5_9FIRM|nr:PTS transporter subunit IIC [Lucifera butyrica]VBB05075.1 phosphotransferase system sugar-specific permease component [Lucifera butyrica]
MFLQTLKLVFDTFGAPVFVPVIIFGISKILKVNNKKAFFSALYAGVGLEGFTLLLNAFTPIITPVVKKMVESTGIQLPAFDVGWQATALVAYSTEAGMLFLGIGLCVQTVLFLTKWTTVFQPADLWNNYSYMVWGSMIYLATQNMVLALSCMILLNLYSLLIAELMAKRWSTYYNYPNCTIISMHNIEAAVFTVVFDPLLNRFGLNKVKLSPEQLQKKLGFFGEPVSLGLLLGLFIGIMGEFKELNTLAAWGQVAVMGIATSAIMAIFPRVAGLFAQAFLPITEAARKAVKKDAKARQWFLGINDATGYGESATLISGIILIPVMVLLALILPGNQVLPVVDLLALPFMVQGIVPLVNGNILKVLITGAVWFSAGLYMCSYTAPLFTQIAASVGVHLPVGALLITSFNILGKPLMGLIFLAFLSQSPLLIGLAAGAYLILYYLFRTNREAVYNYLDRKAMKNSAAETDAGVSA